MISSGRSGRLVIPLQESVLCVDCECIGSGHLDRCQVCGSESLLPLSRVLDGNEGPPCTAPSKQVVHYNLVLTIELPQMVPSEMSRAIERISRLVEQRLGHPGASFHIAVEPLTERSKSAAPQAA